MSCRLPPWNQESLKNNIFYVTTYDQYSNYIWVTIVAHIPWISQLSSYPAWAHFNITLDIGVTEQ